MTRAEVRAQQRATRRRGRRTSSARASARAGARAGTSRTPTRGAARRSRSADEARAELEARIERLARRREQLGPVNPLAKDEYDEAVAHVEELETQRADLEAAMAELEGLISETDQRIREAFEETFEAAARNFEEMVEHLFPGGRGRLRLVQPDGPRPVIGGADAEAHRRASAASRQSDPAAGERRTSARRPGRADADEEQPGASPASRSR